MPRHTQQHADRRDEVPPRRRGGQELPDSVQDRPEQNEGYDAAVNDSAPGDIVEDLEAIDLERAPRDQQLEISRPDGEDDDGL